MGNIERRLRLEQRFARGAEKRPLVVQRSEEQFNTALAAVDAWKSGCDAIDLSIEACVKSLQKMQVVLNMEPSALKKFQNMRKMYSKDAPLYKELDALQKTVRSIGGMMASEDIAKAVLTKSLEISPVAYGTTIIQRLSDIEKQLKSDLSRFEMVFQSDAAPKSVTRITVTQTEPGTKESLKAPAYKSVLETLVGIVDANLKLMETDHLTALNAVKELNEFLQHVMGYADIKQDAKKEEEKDFIRKHPLYKKFEPFIQWQKPEGKTQIKISDEFVQAALKEAAAAIYTFSKAIIADMAAGLPGENAALITEYLSAVMSVYSDGFAAAADEIAGPAMVPGAEEPEGLRAAASRRSISPELLEDVFAAMGAAEGLLASQVDHGADEAVVSVHKYLADTLRKAKRSVVASRRSTASPLGAGVSENAGVLSEVFQSALSLWGFMRRDLSLSKGEREAADRSYQKAQKGVEVLRKVMSGISFISSKASKPEGTPEEALASIREEAAALFNEMKAAEGARSRKPAEKVADGRRAVRASAGYPSEVRRVWRKYEHAMSGRGGSAVGLCFSEKQFKDFMKGPEGEGEYYQDVLSYMKESGVIERISPEQMDNDQLRQVDLDPDMSDSRVDDDDARYYMVKKSLSRSARSAAGYPWAVKVGGKKVGEVFLATVADAVRECVKAAYIPGAPNNAYDAVTVGDEGIEIRKSADPEHKAVAELSRIKAKDADASRKQRVAGKFYEPGKGSAAAHVPGYTVGDALQILNGPEHAGLTPKFREKISEMIKDPKKAPGSAKLPTTPRALVDKIHRGEGDPAYVVLRLVKYFQQPVFVNKDTPDAPGILYPDADGELQPERTMGPGGTVPGRDANAALDPKSLRKGQEQYKEFKSRVNKKAYVQYDFRDHDGELFSTTADTLEEARRRRDEWHEKKKGSKGAKPSRGIRGFEKGEKVTKYSVMLREKSTRKLLSMLQYDTKEEAETTAAKWRKNPGFEPEKAVVEVVPYEVNEGKRSAGAKQVWWDVFLRGKEIDSVPYDESYKTAEEVKKSLVDHDGYDSGIVVKRSTKRNKPEPKNRGVRSARFASGAKYSEDEWRFAEPLRSKTGTRVYTEGGKVKVSYHNTVVGEFDPATGHVVINNGGWFTATTKDRINEILGVAGLQSRVFQKGGAWFVQVPGEKPVEYKNGMEITASTRRGKKVVVAVRKAVAASNEYEVVDLEYDEATDSYKDGDWRGAVTLESTDEGDVLSALEDEGYLSRQYVNENRLSVEEVDDGVFEVQNRGLAVMRVSRKEGKSAAGSKRQEGINYLVAGGLLNEKVADIYDTNPDIATAISDVVGEEFEYPDYSHMTVRDVIKMRKSSAGRVRRAAEEKDRVPYTYWDEYQLAKDFVAMVMAQPDDYEGLYGDIVSEGRAEGQKDSEIEDSISKSLYDDQDLWDTWWDDFMSGLDELMQKYAKKFNMWDVSGRNMGWQHRSGEKRVQLKNARELIDETFPQTNQFTAYFYDNGAGFDATVSHHDAPMGEGRTYTPVAQKFKAGDKVTIKGGKYVRGVPEGMTEPGEVIDTDFDNERFVYWVRYQPYLKDDDDTAFEERFDEDDIEAAQGTAVAGSGEPAKSAGASKKPVTSAAPKGFARVIKSKMTDGSYNWIVQVRSSDGETWVTVRNDFFENQEYEAYALKQDLETSIAASYQKTP